MGLWFREWLKVGTAVALLGGLLWLAVERDVGLPALLKSAAWGLVVWVAGGLIWIGLQYGHRREAAREWSRINRVTSSGFSPVNRAPRTGSAGSTAAAHSTVEVFTVDGATAAGIAAETPILPPRSLVPHQRNGQLYYVSADPDVCECLYVGHQLLVGEPLLERDMATLIARQIVLASARHAGLEVQRHTQLAATRCK